MQVFPHLQTRLLEITQHLVSHFQMKTMGRILMETLTSKDEKWGDNKV